MKQLLFKVSVFVFICANISLTAYADNAKPIANPSPENSNTTPNSSPGFSVSASGLYLQPSASNLDYAIKTQPLPAPAPTWQQESVSPGYQPAFGVQMQYTFANPVDHLKLTWLNLGTDDSSSASATGSLSVAPSYYFGPGAQELRNTAATGKVEFDLNNINILYGHTISFGNNIKLEPYGGLTAAYLKQDLTSTYTGENTSDVAYTMRTYNTSTYYGIGPHLGFDFVNSFAKHFGLTANIGGSLLVGSMYIDTHFRSQGELNPTPVNTSLADKRETAIVPEFDSKLSAYYHVAFQSGSALSVQAGYIFGIYMKGIHQIDPTSLVSDTFNDGVMAIATQGNSQSNFGINGPFIKLSWLF